RHPSARLFEAHLDVTPPFAIGGLCHPRDRESRLRTLRRLRGAGSGSRWRSHGGADAGALRPGKVRRRFHAGDAAQFPRLLPAIKELLTDRMIYPIVKYGNPVLEKPAAPVTVFDEDLKKLVEDMFASMYAAHGVGLAAPQIGISKRLAVIDVTFKEEPNAKLVLLNPQIIGREGRQTSKEGCLSLPDFHENVTRANIVTVRAQDVDGNW